MANHELRFQEIGQNSSTTPILSIGEIVKSALAKSRTTKASGVIPGFDTGLSSLDEIMGRIHPGDLGFIGADPNAGKTILAQQIAHHISHDLGRSVAFFQLEMDKEDMARRYLAGQANMSTAQVEEGAYEFDQADHLAAAAERVANDRLWIDDDSDLTIEQIRDRCASLKRRPEGLDVAFVDHLLKVEAIGNFRDYFAKVKHVTGRGKIVAKQLGIGLIFLVHRTRGSQRNSPIPTMRDFDGGPSIERDADWVIGLTRPDLYLEEERPDEMDSAAGRKWTERWHACRDTIDIYNLKGRRSKRGEKRSFKFNGRLSRISEIER
jgi:replicative DNA helicase